MVLTKVKFRKLMERAKSFAPPESYFNEEDHQKRRANQILPIDVITMQILDEILNEIKKIGRKIDMITGGRNG